MDILILDDDPLARKLLARQLQTIDLRATGYAGVLECASGHEALCLLERVHDRVGLILCDLQMPGMDGIEFVRRLGDIGFDGNIAFVSGEDARILGAAARVAQEHGLRVLRSLEKPVPIARLRDMVGTARRARPPRAVDAEHGGYSADELRRGLRAGELLNHYQPKVNLKTGAVVGVEALVRWQHPDDGLVAPDRFIGLAEASGLIVELGSIVLARALEDARAWADDGYAVDLAVNMSMSNLMELDFPDHLARQALAAGIPLHRVIIEITESQGMHDPRSQLDILTRLRLKQVRLSIDDFGTGYSGLSQLKDLPFSELKIDRRFVRHAAHDPALQAILDASLGIARELHMSTVAEGVEDRDDWEFLRSTDCLLAQGYFIARPMPPDRLMPWIAQWNAAGDGLAAAAG